MKMPIKQLHTTCQTIAYIPTTAGKTNGKFHHLYEFNSSQNKLNASLHREEVAAFITANLVGRITDPFQLYWNGSANEWLKNKAVTITVS